MTDGLADFTLLRSIPGARCYLQALNLNPNAKHIWSYLRIAFSCMERFDLVNKANTQDVDGFRDEFSLFQLDD